MDRMESMRTIAEQRISIWIRIHERMQEAERRVESQEDSKAIAA